MVGSRGDWDIVIAHMLGVDHVGHTYGPNHPVMQTKLTQMDGFLRQVINTIDDRTLLMVLGDHGMTHDGNHGVLLSLYPFRYSHIREHRSMN